MHASDRNRPKSREAVEMLPLGIRKWAWTQGWRRLRPIQERAITAVHRNPREDVLLFAPDQGGKTESAFLAMLSVLTANAHSGAGIRALYLSPLGDLIDSQFTRLDGMVRSTGLALWRMHSGVSEPETLSGASSPSGVLMATVDAVEDLLARSRTESHQRLEHLEFSVVDELHVFMSSDLGHRLQVLLENLERIAEAPARRLGLSAEEGSPRMACDFLRPPRNASAIVIEEWTAPER